MVVLKNFVLERGKFVENVYYYSSATYERRNHVPAAFLTPTATAFLAGKVTTDVLPLARSLALSGRTRQNTRIQHVSPDIWLA